MSFVGIMPTKKKGSPKEAPTTRAESDDDSVECLTANISFRPPVPGIVFKGKRLVVGPSPYVDS